MSIIITVYANHALSFDTYANGISLIEDFLKIKIQDSQNRRNELYTDEHNVNYFAPHNYFEKRYLENWGIHVYSNFPLCERFVVHKHFVQFDISGKLDLKTHIWQKLVSKQRDMEQIEPEDAFEKTLAEWNNTRKYIADIAKKLGGDTILYLNDAAPMIHAEGLIWDGEEISSVLAFLRATSQLNEYDDLANNVKTFPQNDGFIETLK